jgi:hypothetical protein
MASNAQIQANRMNAQKSTGPKTAEGKAVVAQNTVKHGLFAHDNVIQCEKQSDFDSFCEGLLTGLAPVGGVETMLAERIVSLSWRLKRVERMNSEAVDVMIAKIETNSSERRWRGEAGLLDPESGQSELGLGWAIIKDFSGSNVLERLLMYEKRIESSLYKAMNELQKLQLLRKKEEIETMKSSKARPSPSLRDEAATHRGRDARDTINQAEEQTDQTKKQSQLLAVGGKSEKGCSNTVNLKKQSQLATTPAVEKASQRCD